MRVLNVGSGPASIPILDCYTGHEITRLDIDPQWNADLVMDVRDVGTLGAGAYDVVFCSHVLEHFYLHEAEGIARGFYHALTDDGACDVIVPDVGGLLARGDPLKLDQVLYTSGVGPITVHDMLYGFSPCQRGTEHPEYHAHKSAWGAKQLCGLMHHCGFTVTYSASYDTSLRVIAFKRAPGDKRLRAFGVGVQL